MALIFKFIRSLGQDPSKISVEFLRYRNIWVNCSCKNKRISALFFTFMQASSFHSFSYVPVMTRLYKAGIMRKSIRIDLLKEAEEDECR